jgi:hypothetical protein
MRNREGTGMVSCPIRNNVLVHRFEDSVHLILDIHLENKERQAKLLDQIRSVLQHHPSAQLRFIPLEEIQFSPSEVNEEKTLLLKLMPNCPSLMLFGGSVLKILFMSFYSFETKQSRKEYLA